MFNFLSNKNTYIGKSLGLSGLGAFNPLSLFSNGEEGVIYDPSDISRYMSNLGPELVSNGTFDTNTSGWTAVSPVVLSWSSDGMIVNRNGGSFFQQAGTPINLVAGKTYLLSFTNRVAVIGAFAGIEIANTSRTTALYLAGGAFRFSAVGTYSTTFTATTTESALIIAGLSGAATGTVTLDNISLKELTAIDTCSLYQDSLGTTPVTGVEQPVGLMLDKSRGAIRGPELLSNGDFSSGATGWSIPPPGWALTGSTCTATAAAGSLRQIANPYIAGKFYEVTFDWTHTSGLLYVRVGVGTAVTFNTSGRKRVILMANGTTGIELYGGAVSGIVDNISVKEVYGNHAYQTTAIDRPILRQDVNGKYYLACNGTNTWMHTNNINMTGTDKVSIFAGLQKLTSTTGIFAEFSADSNSNNGSFYFAVGLDNYIDGISSLSRGTMFSNYGQIAFSASGNNVKSVIAVTHDISSDLSTIRHNGIAGTSGTYDKGAGNFGNYPLYLFRRAGTSFPFNGNLYGLIIRGKLSTDSQIQKVEKYLAKKTGITL